MPRQRPRGGTLRFCLRRDGWRLRGSRPRTVSAFGIRFPEHRDLMGEVINEDIYVELLELLELYCELLIARFGLLDQK